MNEEFLAFAKPSISDEAIAEVVACLKSGWITTGPRVQRFEEALRQYLKSTHALTVSSATAGLHLALLSLNLAPGDEVITTALTFVATLNTIVQAGGKPVLVDIDPATLNLNLDQIEKVITPRTKVIMPVHFAGLPVDLDPLYQLAEKYQLRVIEDAAQAIGTKYKNKILGSFGDIQVFSFHPNKNMTTGEGGCITTASDELAKSIQAMRFHGIDRQAWDRFSKKGSQYYDVVTPGFKYNMMDIQAALGIHQLQDLETFIEKRTVLAQRYLKRLQDWPQIRVPQLASFDHRHSWHLFTILINEREAGMNRDTFMAKLKELNIGTGLHYQPVHLYHYYQTQFGFRAGDFPCAEDVCSRIVSLPLFPDMTFEQQDRVISAMAQIFQPSKIPTFDSV